MSNRPIGVFDSGLGGLTCVKQLISLLPDEDIIYFGDTARVPYGNRSRAVITRYALQAVGFLLDMGVKFLINACGSMSSSLPGSSKESFPVPYIDCILPTAKAAADATKNKHIGVIATNATVMSGSFTRAIADVDPEITVTAKACPLFVPLVENGYISPDNKITRLAAEDYLKDLKPAGVDVLILGCTHYPIIKPVISEIMGSGVVLIDSGAEAAKEAAGILKTGSVNYHRKGHLKLYISDNPAGFLDVASTFLGFVPDDIEQIDTEVIEERGMNR